MFRWMGTKEGLRNIDDGYEGSLTSSVGSKRGMMSEGAAGERDTANGPPARKRPHLCYNPALPKVSHQEIEAAKLEIAPEDDPNPLGLVLDDHDLAVLGLVSERDHAADPKPLAFGSGDLVPDALGG